MTEMDRRLKRVRALLDRAQRVDTEPREAEAASRKAMRLITEYGISQAMLDAAGGQDEGGLDSVTITMHAPYTYEKAELLTAIGFVFGCESSTRGWRGRHAIESATLYGYRSDLDRTQMLYTSLVMQATNEMARTREPAGVSRVTFLRDFLFGFANAVITRLKAMQNEVVEQYEQEHAGETGAGNLPISVLPVLASRRERVRSFFEEQTGDLETAEPIVRDGVGVYAGHIAGQTADLGDGRTTVAGGPAAQGRLVLDAPARALPDWLTYEHWATLADVAMQNTVPAAAEMGASVQFLHDVLYAVVTYCRKQGGEFETRQALRDAAQYAAAMTVAGDPGKVRELASVVLAEIYDRIDLWASKRRAR